MVKDTVWHHDAPFWVEKWGDVQQNQKCAFRTLTMLCFNWFNDAYDRMQMRDHPKNPPTMRNGCMLNRIWNTVINFPYNANMEVRTPLWKAGWIWSLVCRNLWIYRIICIRGHPFMTSTKKSGFWPPCPHASTWAGPPLPPCGRPHTVEMKYTPLSWNG